MNVRQLVKLRACLLAGLIAMSGTSSQIAQGAAALMSLVRVHNLAISLDGFGTGEGQSRDLHFGHAGDRLHEWMFATRWWAARSPAEVAASMTPSRGSSSPGSARRSWVPGSSATRGGTRTRTG